MNKITNSSDKKAASKSKDSKSTSRSKTTKKGPSPLKMDFNISDMIKNKLIKVLAIVAVVGILLGAVSVLLYENKHHFVVARVDGTFITRSKLNSALMDAYGRNMLDELITRHLVESEVEKRNIEVTEEELAVKIIEVEEQVVQGTGMELEEYLDTMGMGFGEFEKNIRTQLKIEKILRSEVEVSEEEIEIFLEQNEEFFGGESREENREEALEILTEQAMNRFYQEWLTSVREEAEIVNYLE